jgi:hypothetical protein
MRGGQEGERERTGWEERDATEEGGATGRRNNVADDFSEAEQEAGVEREYARARVMMFHRENIIGNRDILARI